jgi:hypothetical protein
MFGINRTPNNNRSKELRLSMIYVCGPISGYAQGNEPLFRQAATYLETRGHLTLVPHDIKPIHEGPCPISHTAQTTGDHGVACFLRIDIIEMLMQCDGVYVLPGWQASVGARLEIQVAAACGLEIRFADDYRLFSA